jgi:hypothetical protein
MPIAPSMTLVREYCDGTDPFSAYSEVACDGSSHTGMAAYVGGGRSEIYRLALEADGWSFTIHLGPVTSKRGYRTAEEARAAARRVCSKRDPLMRFAGPLCVED